MLVLTVNLISILTQDVKVLSQLIQQTQEVLTNVLYATSLTFISLFLKG